MLYIFIANYYPEFKDGRVKRVQALEKYLLKNKKNYKVISLGEKTKDETHSFKFKSEVLKKVLSRNIAWGNSKSASLFNRNLLKILNHLVWPDRYFFDSMRLYFYMKKKITSDDVIFISSPWFSFLIFAFLPTKNIFLDFRDLYLGNKIFSKIPFLDSIFLKKALSKSQKIFVTNKSAQINLKHLDQSLNVAVVPNGITEAQFNFIKTIKNNLEVNTSTNLIGHFGNLGGKRNALDFLSAISRSDSQLRLVGNFAHEYIILFGDCCSDILPWEDMIKSALECEYLLVIIREDEHAEFAIPGKVYEYIALQKPIILYSPKNAAVRLFLLEINYKHAWVDSEEHIEKQFNIHDIEFKGLLECEPVIRERYFEKEFSQF